MDSQTQYCLMRRDLEERVWRLTNRVPELTSGTHYADQEGSPEIPNTSEASFGRSTSDSPRYVGSFRITDGSTAAKVANRVANGTAWEYIGCCRLGGKKWGTRSAPNTVVSPLTEIGLNSSMRRRGAWMPSRRPTNVMRVGRIQRAEEFSMKPIFRTLALSTLALTLTGGTGAA